MFGRLISFCIVLIISSQNLVPGHPSKHYRSLSNKANISINSQAEITPDTEYCPFSKAASHQAASSHLMECCRKSGSSAEMACCQQGRTTAASPVVRVCCEIVCGHTGDVLGLSNITTQLVGPNSSADNFSLISLKFENPGAIASQQLEDRPLPHYNPPPLYLNNSVFLI